MAIDLETALKYSDTAARLASSLLGLVAYGFELRAKAIAGDEAAAVELEEMERDTSGELGRWRLRRKEIDAAADAKLLAAVSTLAADVDPAPKQPPEQPPIDVRGHPVDATKPGDVP